MVTDEVPGAADGSVVPVVATVWTLSAVAVAAVGALALTALVLGERSSDLLSPPPAWMLGGVVLLWIGTAVAVGVLVAMLPLPRLVRRLAILLALAVSGWGFGTVGRALYSVAVFDLGGPTERTASTWQVVGMPSRGDGPRTVSATSFARNRTVSVTLSAAASAAAPGPIACVRLVTEVTATGAERLVRLGEIGPEDVLPCEAMQRR
ncbi:MAG: hypothetical protein H6733_01620 [Alphaproteobacteria bacterium]|nr:hypothetical protein [Alphaproteobacteria bacterium]